MLADLVHLLTVRRVQGAADGVKMTLDYVCAQWQRRVVGMRSTLDADDGGGGEIETAMFEALGPKYLDVWFECSKRAS